MVFTVTGWALQRAPVNFTSELSRINIWMVPLKIPGTPTKAPLPSGNFIAAKRA